MHSQCLPGSGICKIDASLLATGDTLTNLGECVQTSDVIYVDRGFAGCATGDGTQTKPYCEINQAISTGKSYIVVKGNGSAMANMYQPTTVDNGKQVAIFGPGRDVPANQQALISGVTVLGGARATLNGLTVTNSAGQPAVQCSGSATLYIQNAQITNLYNSGGGIYANLCSKVDVEKTRINSVFGYGIFLTGGAGHRIINNAIVNGNRNSMNITEQTGMRISGNADGLFSFNTIANNFQGVLCDSAVTLSDSIIVANGADPQVSGNCQAMRTVVNKNQVVLNPLYTSAGDPTLTSDPLNDACCIDKGLPDANKTIKDDYYGTKRPLGGGFDIGFQEAR